MKPDLQASLLCDDVRQERNGKFILIGIFDVVAFPSFPVAFQRICIVNRWCCGEGRYPQQSRILKPDMTLLAEGKKIQINLLNTQATATSVEYFLNVKFESEGLYWIEVLLDSDLKLRYPLMVKSINHKEIPHSPDTGNLPAN